MAYRIIDDPKNHPSEFPLVWAEIDLDAVLHNVRELRRITHPSSLVMAVVKANGYGHGAFKIAEAALKGGAAWLGVANLVEALSLRKAGFDAPILIFGYTHAKSVRDLVDFNLSQSVYSLEMAQMLSAAAVSLGENVKIHVKIDTGMGRLGILAHDPMDLMSGPTSDPVVKMRAIASLEGIELEGVFTHFATADQCDKSYAALQFSRFMDFIGALRFAGISPKMLHAANSAAVIDMPETHLDMVRPGISIYGLYPSPDVDKSKIILKPALTLKTRVIHLKQAPAGFKVSYGITYETASPTTIATVPIGYADGFSRRLSSCGHMLIRGCRAPVAGRVCMDLVMLDVGHIPDVAIGDEVVVMGRQEQEAVLAEEVAQTLDTIHYEVLTSIGERVKRIYID
jgi:alanine racemase